MKELELKMESKEGADQHHKLLLSIISSIAPDTKVPMHLLEDNFDLDNISEEEWDLLSNNVPIGRKKLKFNCVFFPGDTILQESVTTSHQVYRITAGTCEIVKRVPNPMTEEPETVKVATLHAGDIFGVVGFLLGIRSTATVVANTMVEVQIIDNFYLKRLFKTEHFLVLKLYYRIASNIAQLIVNRGDEGWTPTYR